MLSDPPFSDYRGDRQARRLNGFLDEERELSAYDILDTFSEAKERARAEKR